MGGSFLAPHEGASCFASQAAFAISSGDCSEHLRALVRMGEELESTLQKPPPSEYGRLRVGECGACKANDNELWPSRRSAAMRDVDGSSPRSVIKEIAEAQEIDEFVISPDACLACLETGPVPAYSHALERRSGPRHLHKYRVLAPAPPRCYVSARMKI